ncbi:hypothetical protein VaNZ11_012974 [Volvox africanus]|uniref:NIF system FeS cluster assembly NifU C-terminal domain-containing protein n=1 Tax=Volvox africanus TaxID=51714 RepID=A0ABQ5SFI0_9CHLO|nr:hypothetical protein VaNZ11_012974 [Volvox africanus]
MTSSSFACNLPRQGLVRSHAPSQARVAAFHPVMMWKESKRRQVAVFAMAVPVVDDKTVPEAHKGLHGFLYGDGGSEEHDRGSSYTVRTGEDEGSVVMLVPAYLDSRDGEKPLGVYCVYDSDHIPQYIGYSRNMVLAVKGHLARMGPGHCAYVRAMVYGNKSMASRTNLERGVHNWINELPELQGRAPPGNTDAALRMAWEGVTTAATDGGDGPAPAPLDRGVMSPAELAAYEEKKLKLRKAMGEKMVEGPGGSTVRTGGTDNEDGGDGDDLATRRLKLMKAMERGDWSAVIHAQTQETLPQEEAEVTEGGSGAAGAEGTSGGNSGGTDTAADSSPSSIAATTSESREVRSVTHGTTPLAGGGGDGGVVSPFSDGGVAAGQQQQPQGTQQTRPLTVEAVQIALEEVRPYLMADGGDVEVVEVKDGVVYLRLQGACSSCPSQSATMKGGIERVIRQNFGDQVRDILQLDPQDPAATLERVDSALNMLRGAIANLGGSAEVLGVENGVCTIRYRGPPAIGKGVQGAIKDSFQDIREVRLVD